MIEIILIASGIVLVLIGFYRLGYSSGYIDGQFTQIDKLKYSPQEQREAIEKEWKNKLKPIIKNISIELDNEPDEGEQSVGSWIEEQFSDLLK